MNRTTQIVLGLGLAVCLTLGGFLGGLVTGEHIQSKAFLSDDRTAFEVQVDEVRGLLAREALKPPKETSETVGAIQGILESTGDTYANYFDPQHYKYFNEQTMGSFGGIGVTLGSKDGQAYIVEVFPDTPAAKAGIKSGDVFVSIDGVKRDKWETEEVVKRVRGDEGTKVTIEMRRKGEKELRKFELVRAQIEYPNVESKRYGDVGYIRMAQFNQKAAQDIADEIKKLEKAGATSFVLDLRDNPGGLLDAAVGVTSLFVEDGVIVRVEQRNQPEVEHRATGGRVTDAPLVVLVNGNSASASEITAGALQDYGRATIVGEKTFGKGSVQTVKELSGGGAVKFTIAHYLTPKKRVIDGKGVTPDIVVKMDAEKQMDPKTDTQLQRALAEARRQIARRD